MSAKVLSLPGNWQALMTAVGVLALGWTSNPASAAVAARSPAPTNTVISSLSEGDLLQFADGSSLHGQLQSMNPAGGVGWKHPDAKALIQFRPTNIAWIRFAKPTPVSPDADASCRFRFSNGDEVFGQFTSMRDGRLQLDSWFHGALEAPREVLQSVTFLSKGFTILYEGPSGPEGWVHGRTARAWEYRDGAFLATGAGTLGRDFGLTSSSSVSFDLAWNGHFSLILALYTQVLDRFDYSSSSYMFYLSPGYISLQRVQGGAGAMNLGQAAISEMSRKNRLHLEIRANKEDNTLGLLVDDRLVQRWKDSAGFVGRGSGIVFFAQLDGPSIKITNLKVSQWQGSSALETVTSAPTKEDVVFLANRDKVTGRLRGLQDGVLSVEAGERPLEIPLSRVSQISLAASATNAPLSDPWHVRAYFAGGGSLAFQLDDWSNGRARGTSPNFGPVDLESRFIRQLQFNPHRPRVAGFDMEIMDQDIWDLE